MNNLTIFKSVLKYNIQYPALIILGTVIPIAISVGQFLLGIEGVPTLLLMALLWSSVIEGLEIFNNKEKGTEIRILASPTSYLGYLTQTLLANTVLMAIRIIIFLTIGIVLNGWGLLFTFGLFIVYMLFSISIIALAFMLSRIFNKLNSAMMAFSFVSTLFTMLGGLWFPVELLPRFLEIIGMLSPVYWASAAITQLSTNGINIDFLLACIAIAGYVIIFMLLGSFKK
ncbi:MAG: ABC transporter permease [Defluviitaleaceae bacterium]|nr:ABC transporter permease [Defluviitaleaceae bacterium]